MDVPNSTHGSPPAIPSLGLPPSCGPKSRPSPRRWSHAGPKKRSTWRSSANVWTPIPTAWQGNFAARCGRRKFFRGKMVLGSLERVVGWLAYYRPNHFPNMKGCNPGLTLDLHVQLIFLGDEPGSSHQFFRSKR